MADSGDKKVLAFPSPPSEAHSTAGSHLFTYFKRIMEHIRRCQEEL